MDFKNIGVRWHWGDDFKFLFNDFNDLLICGSDDFDGVLFLGQFVFALFDHRSAALADDLAEFVEFWEDLFALFDRTGESLEVSKLSRTFWFLDLLRLQQLLELFGIDVHGFAMNGRLVILR